MKKYVIAAAFIALSASVAGAYEPPASMFGQNNSFSPSAPNNLASQNYTLGIKFTVNVSKAIRRLSFFKSGSDTTTGRNLILWTSGGTNLAECTTNNEPSGFNQWLGCAIEPYDVSSGTVLYVTYDVPSGGHWANTGPGVCLSQAHQNWITCNAVYYANSLSTFPTNTTTWTELPDIVLH